MPENMASPSKLAMETKAFEAAKGRKARRQDTEGRCAAINVEKPAPNRKEPAKAFSTVGAYGVFQNGQQ